jgi:hypothetical protein
MAIRGSGRRPERSADISEDLATLDRVRRPASQPAVEAAEPAVDAAGRFDAAEPEFEAAGRVKALAAAAPAHALESTLSEPAPRTRIGVVVIHGIGDQKPGETLLLWARSLLRIVNAWAATTPGVRHANDHAWTADIDLTGGSRPWVAIDVPAAPGPPGGPGHEPQTWLMTEAWWAARVSPPSLPQLFRWLVPKEMLRLMRGIFSGIAAEGDPLFKAIDLVFLPLFVVPTTALAVLVYLVLRIVRFVPYKPLQDFALFKALDFFLVDWFGDLQILLTDRTQAASIRARAADAIRACRERGCDTVVVIGHSGGTVVGYATLADEAYVELPVQRLVTLGQALGIAWRLGHVDDPTIADRIPDHLYPGDRLDGTPAEVGRTNLEWYDFWATHDPAPAGGFATGPAATTPAHVGGASTRVFNRMSLLEDHGAYWANDEEFLLPVARLIETSPENAPPSTSRFFPNGPAEAGAPGAGTGSSAATVTLDPRVARRQERVKALQSSWALVMAAGALAVPFALLHPWLASDTATTTIGAAGSAAWGALVNVTSGAIGGLLGYIGITPPSGPLDPVLASLLGAGLMFGAFWLVGQAASGIWTTWDGRERQIALQPDPAWRPLSGVAIPLALCGIGALALLAFAGSGSWLLAAPTVALIAVAEVVAAVGPRGTIANPGS